MYRFALVILLVILITPISAQVQHLNRYELEHGWENYLLVSNEEHGALLVIPQRKVVKGKIRIDLKFLDQDLNEAWHNELTLKETYQQRGYHVQGSTTYLVYQNRSQEHLIKIFKIDPLKNEISEWETSQILELDFREFEVVNNSAIIAGYFNQRPVAYIYDLATERTKIIPNVYQNNSELIELKANKEGITFNIVVSQLNSQKERTMLVSTYDFEGRMLREYQLETPEGHQLLSAVSSSVRNRESIVAGVYSRSRNLVPEGIFINHVDEFGVQKNKFFNFGEFETFFKYQGDKAEKLTGKALRASRANKPFKFKTDGILRPMIETDDKIVVSGEFFKTFGPTAIDYIRFLFWQRQLAGTTTNDNLVNQLWRGPFDGFVWPSTNGMDSFNVGAFSASTEITYSHSFAFAIDLKGALLWDGSSIINETVVSGNAGPTHMGDFLIHNQKAYYAHYIDENLRVTRLDAGYQPEKAFAPIELPNETDEISFERDKASGLIRWYDNKFLAYGIQHIKGENNRVVYFVKSVAVGPDSHISKLD